MRKGVHEVAPVEQTMLKKCKCFATLGKSQLMVKVHFESNMYNDIIQLSADSIT
jgi:hypothetical protein